MKKLFNQQLVFVGNYLNRVGILDNTAEIVIGNFLDYISKRLNYEQQLLNFEDSLLCGTYPIDTLEVLYALNARLESITLK